MAFKGFGKLEQLSKDVDAFAASATLIGPIRAAEAVVQELQYAGPVWTGRFANSWQIEGPQGQLTKGSGQPGTTQPVKFMSAPFSGPQAASIFLKRLIGDRMVFSISNFATGPDGPYALKAMDIQEGKFTYPGVEPIKKLRAVCAPESTEETSLQRPRVQIALRLLLTGTQTMCAVAD